jgi:hypothetical protein
MTDRIEREQLLPATTEEVWEFVTGGDWLADEVHLDLRPGGDALFVSGGERKSGWVEEASPPPDPDSPGRLVFWWAADGEPASRVELELEPAGWACTRLRVLESRPLELLDLVGMPLPGSPGQSYGPALVAA